MFCYWHSTWWQHIAWRRILSYHFPKLSSKKRWDQEGFQGNVEVLKHMTKYCTHLGDHPTSFSESNLPFDPELIPNLQKHGSSGVEEFLAPSTLIGKVIKPFVRGRYCWRGTLLKLPWAKIGKVGATRVMTDDSQPLLRVGHLNWNYMANLEKEHCGNNQDLVDILFATFMAQNMKIIYTNI